MIQSGLPRKVTIGTCWMTSEKGYPGLAGRLDRLERLVDNMAEVATERGTSLDIACLCEDANTAGWLGDLDERAEDLPAASGDAMGPTLERMAAVARRHATYLIVPHFVRAGGRMFNSAVLLDRTGAILGRYDKLHGVEEPEGSGQVERGCTPGARVPTWDLDFGRVGIQICFDLLYDDGWQSLERSGAELVFWPSAYPGVRHLASRAWRHQYFVVSCPWRPPCGIYDPTGSVLASGDRADGAVLVERVDLEYRLMPWKAAKDGGAALKARYGEEITIFYRRQEDVWMFWSNSDENPVDRIIEDCGLETLAAYLERMRRLQADTRGGGALL